MKWFDVDREGLAKLLEAKGKSTAILELVQNAWDADGCANVTISLTPVAGMRKACITITDDSPNGFVDLSHAWTLFAESNRKRDAEKRGRFNLGEKLVLALCDDATITTTTGSVSFDAKGRHRHRARTECGSRFEATIRMTREEINDALTMLRRAIPPNGIATIINSEPLQSPTLVRDVSAYLQTEYANADGVLRITYRHTTIHVYEANGDGWLYELGIPVVATRDRWSCDVQQKVPLNFNRDNVNPSFLRDVRAAVVSVMADELTEPDTKSDMVTTVMSVLPADAVKAIMLVRFGANAVVYDPSDIEANKIAMAEGRQVIYGNAFDAATWDSIRSSGAVLPAGKVTPSPKPFSDDGAPLQAIDPAEYTPEMARAVSYIRSVGSLIIGSRPQVILTADPRWRFDGCYGEGRITVNIRKVDITLRRAVDELVIHEFAHDKVSDHLSSAFHERCCEIGALLIEATSDCRIGWHGYEGGL